MKGKFRQMKFGKPYKAYILPKKRRRIGRWAAAILIISAVAYAFFATAAALTPAIEKVSVKLLEVNASRIINDAITESLDGNVSYDDLAHISYDDDGSVKSITTHTSQMNRLKSFLTLKILSSIEQNGSKGFSVPLGSLTDIMIFSGVGPDIPFKIIPYGSATVDFRNEFTSAGINQTRHEIYIDITVDLQALSTVSGVRGTVTTSVMAAQTVIVGETPHFFAD